MRFTVEYQPMISSSTRGLVKQNLTPTMTSNDSEQYNLDETIEQLKSEIDYTDMLELKRLQKEMVDYIEF